MGGIANGKKWEVPGVLIEWRKYPEKGYKGFVVGDGHKKIKDEAGTYILKGDTCIEMATFSIRPGEVVNKPIHYFYTLRNDSLILKGIWSPGAAAEEYWVKMK